MRPTGRLNKLQFHRPKIYRYRVAKPGFSLGFSQYPCSAERRRIVPFHRRDTIGFGVTIGAWRYCVKWARPGSWSHLDWLLDTAHA